MQNKHLSTASFQITPGRRSAAEKILRAAPGIERDVQAIAERRGESLQELLHSWSDGNPNEPHSGYGFGGGSALDRRLVLELLVSRAT